MIIKVSTDAFIFSNHSKAFSSLLFHSNQNGLVTIHTVKIHISFAKEATTGQAHVPVHHHIQHVTNTISLSCKCLFNSSKLSSAAFLPISGLAHQPNHLVIFKPIFILLGAKLFDKACASVFIATYSTPPNQSITILFNVLQPHHQTPNTAILAQGIKSGIYSFTAMCIFT
jgi:hypothetical protein